MTPPSAAAAFVAAEEGFRAAPYRCPAGVPTIGFGTTRYPDGRAVAMGDPTCTREQALAWLEHDLAAAGAVLAEAVRVPLTEGMCTGLLSFIYNLGPGAFRGSTLLRRLNAGDRVGAAREFGRWVRSGQKTLPGLVSRRAREAAVFAS